MGEVGADREALLEGGRDVAWLGAARVELLGHRVARQVGDVREHAGERESDHRSATLRVVLAAAEVRVVHDRVSPDHVEGDCLARESRRTRDDDAAADAFGVTDRPGHRLLAAERAADDRAQARDAEPFERAPLSLDHVADRDRREVGTVGPAGRRVDRRGAGRAATAAEYVLADHEEAVGVDRLTGADEDLPPARRVVGVVARRVRVAGEGVADEDRVVALGGEFSPGLAGDLDFRESSTEFELERSVEPKVPGVRQREGAAPGVAAVEE